MLIYSLSRCSRQEFRRPNFSNLSLGPGNLVFDYPPSLAPLLRAVAYVIGDAYDSPRQNWRMRVG
jgi:hypothetical protein